MSCTKWSKTFNYECLSDLYKNGHSKLIFKCSQEHIYETTWWIFKAGHRCPICENIRRAVKYSGPNCTFWKGGIFEPYCYEWTLEFKDLIKYRDNYRCLNPGCTSGTKLVIHHVDYNKKHCFKENLITICQSCNSKANFDRDWHTLWYQTILNKKYNYVYGRQKLC
jgi:hypothetical protein